MGAATEDVEGSGAIEGTGILGDVGGLTVEGSNVWMAIKIRKMTLLCCLSCWLPLP